MTPFLRKVRFRALFLITLVLVLNALGFDLSRQWTQYHARDRQVSCPITWYPESGVFLSCEGKKRQLAEGPLWRPFADYGENKLAQGEIPTTRMLVSVTRFSCVAEDWRASRWFGTWLGKHASEEVRTQYTHCRPIRT